MQNIHSAFLKLSRNDLVRGLIVTVLSAGLSAIVQFLNATGFGIDWTEVLKIAVTAGGAYLVKNLLTSEDGKFGGMV